jgi:hypothetical protein
MPWPRRTASNTKRRCKSHSRKGFMMRIRGGINYSIYEAFICNPYRRRIACGVRTENRNRDSGGFPNDVVRVDNHNHHNVQPDGNALNKIQVTSVQTLHE